MKTVPAEIDLAAAHRHFASTCFNQVWSLLDKSERNADEDQQMILLAFASLYHWTQRPECTDHQRSVGYWQVSRVFAVLGRSDESLRYARICESFSQNLPPFYRGYAMEAVARAAALSGQLPLATQAHAEAIKQLTSVVDPDEHSLLQHDLASISESFSLQ